MPFDCHIDPEQHLGTVTLRGTVDAQEVVQAIGTLYGHPEWRPGFNALWDGSRISQFIVEPADLDLIKVQQRQVETTFGRGRSAFVVPREAVHLITQLLLHRLPTPARERRTFEQVDEALAWLNDGPEPEEG